MGIDHIGRKGPPAPPVGGEGAQNVGSPAATFPTAAGTPVAVPAAPVEASALARLRSGEITLDGYLDVKVAEATGHLKGLAPDAVQAIREALRDQLASDPGLADLLRTVRSAAGPAEVDGA